MVRYRISNRRLMKNGKREVLEGYQQAGNMAYDEKADIYICHAGKTLKEVSKKKQKSKSGYQSEVTVYECEDCSGCPHKEKCTKAKGNKRLYLSKNFLKKRQESYENILSEKGSCTGQTVRSR